MRGRVYILMVVVLVVGAAGVYFVGVWGRDMEPKVLGPAPTDEQVKKAVEREAENTVKRMIEQGAWERVIADKAAELNARMTPEQKKQLEEAAKAKMIEEIRAKFTAETKADIVRCNAVFQQGVLLFNTGKYEKAREKFDYLGKKKLPLMPPEMRAAVMPLLNLYLYQIKVKTEQQRRRRETAREQLAAGKKALDSDKPAEACAALRKARKTGESLGSAADEELRRLSERAETELRKKREQLLIQYERGVVRYHAKEPETARYLDASALFKKIKESGVSLGPAVDARVGHYVTNLKDYLDEKTREQILKREAAARARKASERLEVVKELVNSEKFSEARVHLIELSGTAEGLSAEHGSEIKRLRAHVDRKLAEQRTRQARAGLEKARQLVADGKLRQARVHLAAFSRSADGLTDEDREEVGRMLDEVKCKLKATEWLRNVPRGMVAVPRGEFTMGKDKWAPENVKPAHKVTLRFFYLDKHEVTNAEYKKFLDWIRANKHVRHYCHPDEPEDWDHTPYSESKDNEFFTWDRRKGTYPEGKGENPVVLVAWWDAYAYARWAGKRLPTEAEWEKAARGTDTRRWPWGDQFESGDCNCGRKIGYTTPCGKFPRGASFYGALDMAGNAWEWCADWYSGDYYKHSPQYDPKGPKSGRRKVRRGGSWKSEKYGAVVTKRSGMNRGARLNDLGFRCVKVPGGPVESAPAKP